jgi:hypothetical protein
VIPRLFSGATGAALGAIAGVVLAFVHADRVQIGSVSIEFGVPLAAATALLAQLWIARVLQRRSAAVGVAIGWMTSSVLMGSANASGDVPLPATTRAMAYLGVTAMLLTIGMLAPVLRRPGGHRRGLGEAEMGGPSAPTMASLGDDRIVGGNS